MGSSCTRERAQSGEYDLIILDEAIGAVSQGQWDLDQLSTSSTKSRES